MDNDKQLLIESTDQAKDLIEHTYFEFVRSVRVKKDQVIQENCRLAEREEQAATGSEEEQVDFWDQYAKTGRTTFNFTWREFVETYKTSRGATHTAHMLGLVKELGNADTARRRITRLVDTANDEHNLGLPTAQELEDKAEKTGKGVDPGSGRKNRKLDPFSDNSTSLFDGEVYSDYTRIPRSRWRIFGKKTSVKQNLALPFFKKYDKIFLLGYQLESSPEIFYELWFDTRTSQFEIHDRSGDMIFKPFDRMNQAVDKFTDLVGDFAGGDIGKRTAVGRDMEGDLEDAATSAVRDRMKGSARDAQRESVEHTPKSMTELLSEDTVDVEAILERSINTRGMLANMINDELFTEYDDSRMTRRLAKNKFWEVFGKKPTFPSKFLNRGSNKAMKIIGQNNEATFIRGFAFAEDKIELEVWLIKTTKGGRSGEATFWVFNITSGDVVASDLRRIRDAYQKVGQVLAAATNDNRSNDRRSRRF